VISLLLECGVEVFKCCWCNEDKCEAELCHVGGADAEALELLCIVRIVSAEHLGDTCDLQALCTARPLVLVVDGKCCVLVLLEGTEFQSAFGEDDEFTCAVFVAERCAADKVAVCNGEGTGAACLDEVFDDDAKFIC
jgi:hypothetical protein